MTTTVKTSYAIVNGVRLMFLDGNDRLTGVVNGDPFSVYRSGAVGVTTHVPVYVADGDRCMIVNAANICAVLA